MKFLGKELDSDTKYASLKASVFKHCYYKETHFCDGRANLSVSRNISNREPCRFYHNGCPVHAKVVKGEDK